MENNSIISEKVSNRSLAEKLKILQTFAEDELNNNILPFWRDHMLDKENGGFFGKINHDLSVDKDAVKGLILNTRVLWTFASVCNKYKNKTDFSLAKRAYQYIEQYFRDEQYNGYYWALTPEGAPADTKKQIYAQAFVIYAYAEFFKISGTKESLKSAIDLYELIETHSFDLQYNGYLEAFAREWSEIEDLRLSEKDMNEKKTMNTHLHILEAYTNLYTIWKSDDLKEKLENLINIFLQKIISSSDFHLNLFFDEVWNVKSTQISFGHDIEATWLLHEAALVLDNKDILNDVERVAVLLTDAALEGLGKLNGLYHESDRLENRFDNDYEWWPQAEALVGLVNSYQLTGNEFYLDKAIQISDFIKKYIVDSDYKEWYFRIDQNGKPIDKYEKAGFWKCPYHNARACLEIINRVNTIIH